MGDAWVGSSSLGEEDLCMHVCFIIAYITFTRGYTVGLQETSAMYTRFCERQTDRTKTRTTETKMTRDRHRETDSQLQKTETRTRWMEDACIVSTWYK